MDGRPQLGARPAETPNAALFPKPAMDAPLRHLAKDRACRFRRRLLLGRARRIPARQGRAIARSPDIPAARENPAYEVVSMGTTGHAESVQVTYDPSKITYGQLLKVYFSVAHDPTELNRQGPDNGSQYRSAIFYSNDEQKRIAEGYIAQLNAARVYSRPIVTKWAGSKRFYPAEDYHQDYLKKNPRNPYIVFNDLPKLDRLQKEFPALYRAD